jgi:hypothetical protein
MVLGLYAMQSAYKAMDALLYQNYHFTLSGGAHKKKFEIYFVHLKVFAIKVCQKYTT